MSINKRILYSQIKYHDLTATSCCCSNKNQCTSVKHAVTRVHLDCLDTLLKAGCQWWSRAIMHVIQGLQNDQPLDSLFTFCIEHDAPREEGEVISCMIRLRKEESFTRVEQLLSSGKCWYEFKSETPTLFYKQKAEYNVNKVHLADVLHFERYDQAKWMFFTKGARMSLQEAEMAARHGYADLMNYYFSQPLTIVDGTIQKRKVSWLLLRNAYRGGSVECLRLAIQHKCPCPEWILEVDTSVECFREILYHLPKDSNRKEKSVSFVSKILSEWNIDFLEIAIYEYREMLEMGLSEIEDFYCSTISDSHFTTTKATLGLRLYEMSIVDRLLHASLYYSFDKHVAQTLLDEYHAKADPCLLYFDHFLNWAAIDWYLSIEGHRLYPLHIGRWNHIDAYNGFNLLSWVVFIYHAIRQPVTDDLPEFYLIDLIFEESNLTSIRMILRNEWSLLSSRKERDPFRLEILPLLEKVHFVTQFFLLEYFVVHRQRHTEEHQICIQSIQTYLTYLNDFVEQIQQYRQEVERVLKEEVKLYHDLSFEAMKFVV